MVITVTGSALFLPGMGVSTFAVPEEGQAYLAGIEGLPEMPASFTDIAFAVTSLVVVVLLFVGNVLLRVAVWRSETLPKWSARSAPPPMDASSYPLPFRPNRNQLKGMC